MDCHVGSVVVVSPEPFCPPILCLLNRLKDVLVQLLVPHRAVVALDISVLLRLARLDVCYGDAAPLSPFHQ